MSDSTDRPASPPSASPDQTPRDRLTVHLCVHCGYRHPVQGGIAGRALFPVCNNFRPASPEGEPTRATVEPSVVREACMDVVGDDAVPPGEAWIEDKRTGRIIGKVTGLTAPAPSPSSGGSEETADGVWFESAGEYARQQKLRDELALGRDVRATLLGWSAYFESAEAGEDVGATAISTLNRLAAALRAAQPDTRQEER